jgi:pimeloyl-ACP methyl ester carboxylesterase
MSLGGYLSLAFHFTQPVSVAGLVLVDTGPGYRDDDARSRWNDYAERTAADLDERGLEALRAGPEVAGAEGGPVGLALAARGILAQHDASVIDSLATIRVPTLVVVGDHDAPFLAAADYMASRIPAATLHVLKDAGHASNLDQPDAFNVCVGAFLEGVT